MAKNLETGNVTKLPTRAAKGAGKSKPAPEPKSMKPEIPAPKKAAATNNDQTAREAAQLRLIGLRQQHHQIDASMEVLRAELKDMNAKRKEIREAIKGTGVPLAIFDEAYYDAETSRVDLDNKEFYRTLVREAYGLATAKQGDLLEKVAKPAQPEVYWEAQGYQDGIAGKDGIPPKDCPPEHGQAWMRGWHMAMERNAKGIKQLKADGDKPAADEPPADDSSDEPEGSGEDGGTEPTTGEEGGAFDEASPEELAKQTARPAAEESKEVLH